MKSTFQIIILLFTVSTLSIAQIDDCITEDVGGYNMLLIGNSFFRPYADKLDNMAIVAGFENHTSTTIIRGGENGRPINFWNDSLSVEHNQIKAALDQGNVDFFGMTSGHDANNPIEGHKAWIDYALQNNPNITIFISLPPFDFPEGDPNGTRPDWNTFALDNGFNSIQEFYDYYVNEIVHQEIIDQLRIEFPSTKIFTIPTGWATFNLNQLNQDSALLDVISMFGPRETSIFTDQKGHQGEIVREAGGLVWLNSLYNVDLSSFDYDTGFNTDLHAVAEDILTKHNPDYSLCFSEANPPEVKCDSTYSVLMEEGIVYAEGLSHNGNSPTTTPKSLLLDIYYPDNDSENRPVYFFIHGGGFSGGSRQQEAIVDQAYYYASRGWVFVSIDYRLRGDLGSIFTGIVPQEWIDIANEIADPQAAGQFLSMYMAQRDSKAAMRWVIANANNYNINTDYITVGGGSAGAITAITLGVSNQEDFRDEINLSDDPTLATTNLDQTYEIRSIVDFWGSNAALEALEAIYGHHRFDSLDPELFIAHGTEDPTVLYSQAEELVALYDSTGAYVELVPLIGRGHGVWGATVDGKSLSDLSFDFLVEQQELILDANCNRITSTIESSTLDVKIFPNPASTYININASADFNFKATLYDLNGTVIKHVLNNPRFITTSLPSGIYLLELKDANTGKRIIKKIVIGN